jgi:hypothetical protein
MKTTNATKKYSRPAIEKIRKRASEIWKRKCQALNTALDDWLEAEREIRKRLGIEHKKPNEYTAAEVRKIRERAQAVRDEKIGSLRTAFDDWIEAEQELKSELSKRMTVNEFFDLWFIKMSAAATTIFSGEEIPSVSDIDDILGKEYIELMTECMK